MFTKVDKDKSKSLDKKELAAALQIMIKKRKGASAGVLEQMFQKIDHDCSDKITLQEFINWFEVVSY